MIKDFINKRIVSDKRFENITEALWAHPFLIAAFICFSLTAFGYDSYKFIDGFTVFGIMALAIGFFFYRLLKKLKNADGSLSAKARPIFLFAAETVACVFVATMFVERGKTPADILFFLLIAIFAVTYFLLNGDKKYREKIFALMIAAGGFALRFAYVLESDIYTRQNDVHKFGGTNGHSAYIEYIFNHLSLPDFDPTTVWQFYHPPLHHIICAGWMKLTTSFGLPYYMACESIQTLTLFYSCACIILMYKLLKFFKLKGKALLIPFAIVVFHPSQIILSGSINNDVLSITFALAAIYTTLVWYRNPSVKGIIKIALCVGLGMMTKLSVAMVAPAIAVVFVVKFIQCRKKWVDFLTQYVVFGVICCPLGLWWSVRNIVRFGTDPMFVPSLLPTSRQYVGNISTGTRLLDFGGYQFKDVFEQWFDGSYLEFNPTIGFLKNSVFGEHMSSVTFVEISKWYPKILFWSAAILAVISFICLVAFQFGKKKDGEHTEKIFMLIITLFTLVNYYRFCFKYPYTCTMNFRYIVTTLFIGAVFIGMFTEFLNRHKEKTAAKICSKLLTALTLIFVLSSFLTYYTLLQNFA